MVPALRAHFTEYEAVHRAYGNKVCHAAGIPLIAVSLLGLLGQIRLAGPLSLAEIALVAVCAWYWRMGTALAPAMLVVFAVFDVAGRALPVRLLAVMFVLGWILQFVGHYVYEKKAPAFARNLVHLVIGPLWTFSWLAGPDR